MPAGIALGATGFGVILRLPIYFQKNYGARVTAIRAFSKGLLSDRINVVLAKRIEQRRTAAAAGPPEFPDAVEDLEYFQDESIEVISQRISDCDLRILNASEIVRRMGWGLVVLSPLFILSSYFVLNPPAGLGFYADLTMVPVAVVGTFTLLEFLALESIISKTEVEFNAIPDDKRPTW